MRSVFLLFVLAVLFLASAYVADVYKETLIGLMGTGLSGILVYIFLSMLSTVVAPLSSLPLVPIASALWGAPIAALASQLGWGIGGIISFGLSRRYGRPLVEKIIAKEHLAKVEERLPEKHQFWAITLLSMTLPTDVLSYALGLFKNVSWKTFVPAMIVGNVPFSFVFAYTGALPFAYQLILIPFVLILILLVNARTNIKKKPSS